VEWMPGVRFCWHSDAIDPAPLTAVVRRLGEAPIYESAYDSAERTTDYSHYPMIDLNPFLEKVSVNDNAHCSNLAALEHDIIIH
jgi:hypothetical protein